MDDVVVDQSDDAPTEPLSPWRFPLIALFVAMVVCGFVANAVWPRWIITQPEHLLMLSSRARYLLLAAVNDVDPVTFAVVGAIRLGLAAFVCYGLGWIYEERALHVFRKGLGMSRKQVKTLHDGFGTLQYLLIPVFVGSNIVCLLAGLHRTNRRTFAALLATGIAARLALYWFFADQLEKPLKSFLDFTERNQRIFLIVSFALVGLGVFRALRRDD